MTEKLLPDEFADLAPLAAEWSLGSEEERCNKRLTTDMATLKAFYAIGFPRVEAIIAYLDTFPNDPAKLPAEARRLYHLALMIMEAAAPIDLEWPTPDITDTFPIERFGFLEPSRRPPT
ncbi:MAG: hypothetical protein JWL84_5616 [Rhodospirillales bacterium]|nr:hypothetical protein [Rhodospirillales bacterium]